MDDFAIELEGGKELSGALIALPAKVEKKFMREALTAGAQPVLQAARSNAPVRKEGGGALRDGLEIVSGTRAGVSFATVRTGQGNTEIISNLKRLASLASKASKAAGGTKQQRRAAKAQVYQQARAELKAQGIQYQGQYYGSILEHGFKHGKSYVPANPWMEKALAASSQEATEIMAAKLKENIEAEGLKE